jgi:hypothetical protein
MDRTELAILRIAALLELATGLALLAVPSVVVEALVGSTSDDAASVVARVLGGALLGLGVSGVIANRETPERGIAVAFGIYNVSTTITLVAAGLSNTADGALLWPTACLHAVVTAALIVGPLRDWRPWSGS